MTLPRLPETGPVGQALEAGFDVAARIRRAQAFHPAGSVWRGEFEVTEPLPGHHVFGRRGRRAALVRFSFGAGLPRPVPDIHGVALRLVDAYGPGRPQDLLLASSLRPPLLRHLLLPVPRGRRALHSSILPYRVDGRGAVLFGARLVGDEGKWEPDGVGNVDLLTSSLTGRWEHCGRFHLGDPAHPHEVERLHFDPWNTGAGLLPSGALNRLRLPAYRGSRRGRHATLEGAPGIAGREHGVETRAM